MARRAAVCLAVYAGLLCSCASDQGLISSFADITSEVDREGLSDSNQNRLMSLAGLLLHTNPGRLLKYKQQRNPTTAIPLTGKDDSSILTRETTSIPKLSDVLDVRDGLIEVRGKAATLVEARLRLVYLRALTAATGKASDVQAKLLSPPKQGELEQAEKDFRAARKAFDAEVIKTQKLIRTPGIMVTRWAVKSKVAAALKLGEILGISGARETLSSGFAVIGGLRTTQLSLGKDFEFVRSNIDGGFSFRWHWIPIRLRHDHDDVRLVTYTIETKRIAYVQDFSSSTAIAARLEASYQQLQNIGATLEKLDKIEIAAAFARVQELSNMALLGGVREMHYHAPWPTLQEALEARGMTERAAQAAKRKGQRETCANFENFVRTYSPPAGENEATSGDGWRVIYAVDVDFEDLHWHFR